VRTEEALLGFYVRELRMAAITANNDQYFGQDQAFGCSFSGTGDDFHEEDLFGVQTHGVPQTTYNAFYVQNVRGNTKIQMRNFS
jgi:hypothetical protein